MKTEIKELNEFVDELMDAISGKGKDAGLGTNFLRRRVMQSDAWKKRESKHLTTKQVQSVISRMDKDL